MSDKKILIVDDAKFARNVLKRSLANSNYTNVVEASTAADAIAQYEKEQPDLTFLDISLPDSEDLGLLEKLLKLDPKAKIVMCSALGQNLIIEKALQMGARDFLTKPFTEKALLNITNKQLTEE